MAEPKPLRYREAYPGMIIYVEGHGQTIIQQDDQGMYYLTEDGKAYIDLRLTEDEFYDGITR